MHSHARKFNLIWLSDDGLIISQIVRCQVPIDSLYITRDINGEFATVKRFRITLHLFQGLCVLFVLDFVSLFIKSVVVFIKEQLSETVLEMIIIHYSSTRGDGGNNHTCHSPRGIY